MSFRKAIFRKITILYLRLARWANVSIYQLAQDQDNSSMISVRIVPTPGGSYGTVAQLVLSAAESDPLMVKVLRDREHLQKLLGQHNPPSSLQ